MGTIALYGFSLIATVLFGFCIGAVLGFFWSGMSADDTGG